MRTASTRVPIAAAALLVLGSVLAGCSGEEEPTPATTSTPSTTSTPAVDVPGDVTLSDPGSTLAVGKPATVVYRVDRDRRAVVTVTVKRIRKGSMKDFKNFSLSAKQRSSTPYYVRAVVRNAGPGKLGRAAVPLYGLDSSDTFFPPTGLVGEFDRCAGGALPAAFRPGDTAARCLVFLVPKKRRLKSVQVRTQDLDEPIEWRL